MMCQRDFPGEVEKSLNEAKTIQQKLDELDQRLAELKKLSMKQLSKDIAMPKDRIKTSEEEFGYLTDAFERQKNKMAKITKGYIQDLKSKNKKDEALNPDFGKKMNSAIEEVEKIYNKAMEIPQRLLVAHAVRLSSQARKDRFETLRKNLSEEHICVYCCIQEKRTEMLELEPHCSHYGHPKCRESVQKVQAVLVGDWAKDECPICVGKF